MSTTTRTQGELQRTFVAMLFAFAVSIVAQEIVELLVVATDNWTFQYHSDDGSVRSSTLWSLLSVASHSLLALLMLCVSWVMWSRSQAGGHVGELTEVFSIKFITFLLEALLVILYYSLSRSAEGDFAAYSKQKTISSYLTPASARPEAMQMFCVFLIFAVWDFIADVATSPTAQKPIGLSMQLLGFATGIATYCSVSIVCGAGAIAVYMAAPLSQTPSQAVAGDLALISLLLLFNQGKPLEHYILKLFPDEQTRRNTKRVPTARTNTAVAVLVALYIACVVIESWRP